MMIPLIFVAAGLVIEDRKAVRTVILLTAITLLLIDRTCILESMSRSWANFDEKQARRRPVHWLSTAQTKTAAFLAQFAVFFWGFVQFVKRIKFKLLGYLLVGPRSLRRWAYAFSARRLPRDPRWRLSSCPAKRS